MIQNFIDSLW